MASAIQKVKQLWVKTIKYGAHFQEDNFNREVQLIGFKKNKALTNMRNMVI